MREGEIRKKILVPLFFLVASPIFVSCGGDYGSPGTTGVKETNVDWRQVAVVPRDISTITSDVDISNATDVADICPGEMPPVTRDHFADISAQAVQVLDTRPAGAQQITGYTIQYIPVTPGAPGVPGITNNFFASVFLNNGVGSASITNTILMSADRKASLFDHNAIKASGPVSYTAVYTVSGQDSFGNPFSFKGQAGFRVGIFNACSGSLKPTLPVPTGLAANAAGASQINLHWDNMQLTNPVVTGYRIYRDNVFITALIANAFADVGLHNGTTYNYQVSTYDSAGNESDRSDPVSATTLP